MGTVSLPNIGGGVDPATITVAVLNGKVDPLATEFNGSIDNDNIKAAAGILATKLNLSTIAQDIAMDSSQILWAKGADVASASSITLGTDGNCFDITGTTTIVTIVVKQAGSIVILHFDGSVTLQEDTGGAENLKLGGSDINATAGDEVILKCDGTDWHFVGGSIATSDTDDNPRALDVNVTEQTGADNTTDEETIYTYTLPANTLGTTGTLRIMARGDMKNDSDVNNEFTIRIKFGGTEIGTMTAVDTSDQTNSKGWHLDATITGTGATNTQWGSVHLGIPPGSDGTGITPLFATKDLTNDTTSNADIIITAQSEAAHVNIEVVRKVTSVELLTAI